jgi:hypothetical protein
MTQQVDKKAMINDGKDESHHDGYEYPNGGARRPAEGLRGGEFNETA